MLLASTLDDISIADAGLTALLGYAVVFAGLISLMIVITLLGKAFSAKKTAAAPAAAAPVAAAPAADAAPKTAAMLMAIVADETGKPLNELRFTSIKEVK